MSTVSTGTYREVRLAARPDGFPRESDFTVAEIPIPELDEGEVLVRNVYMSLDPATRGYIGSGTSYHAPVPIGAAVDSAAVGVVEASKNPNFRAGDRVRNSVGWREYYVSDGRALRVLNPDGLPLSVFLGPLGITGLTAYVGLLDLAEPKPDETVYVSTAMGGVGSLVCQIAKLKGCRVVGSTGSDEKVRFLLERLRLDGAFNYKTVDLAAALARTCPDGIDVYFDNVGGAHLTTALTRMRMHGRVTVCGVMSNVSGDRPAGPVTSGLESILRQRLRVQGFLASDYFHRLRVFQDDMRGWLKSGEVRDVATITDGIENVPAAFIDMLRGGNIGKALVRLSPDPA